MKINPLEAHDRLKHFKEDQSNVIFEGAEECLKINPLSLELQEYAPYIYMFAHPRTAEDGWRTRLLWQPRLQKPKAQTNSYLFRAQAKTDIIEVCWMIPPREVWKQSEKKKVTESDLVQWSIHQFQNKRKELEAPHPEDLTIKQTQQIYERMALTQRSRKLSNLGKAILSLSK